MSELSHYIGNIGFVLSQLGNELQKQAMSGQPINIHGQVRQTMDNLTYYLHNLNAGLDAWRKEILDNNVRIQMTLDSIPSVNHTNQASKI